MRKQFLFMVLMIISMMASAQTTYKTYIKAAKKGDADAQFRIGSCYSKGDGIEKTKRKPLIGGERQQSKGMLYLKAF